MVVLNWRNIVSVRETNEKEVMVSLIVKMKILDSKRNCPMGK
jgi:hypothetical protein